MIQISSEKLAPVLQSFDPLDLVGKRFNEWTVLGFAGKVYDGRPGWRCQCSCGNIAVVSSGPLKRNKSKSCRKCALKNQPKRSRPYEHLYNKLRKNAKERDVPVTLTYEEFLEYTTVRVCLYCLADIEWSPYVKPGTTRAANLDRKENDLGYSKENCAVCCYRCNSIKMHNLTFEQMLEVGNLIAKWEGRS